MARTLRIVNYAVNGTGVGHLTRLIAINRWIRRYAAHAGVHAEIFFLTSSEADGLLFSERFASFKLPSKTLVGEAGIDKLSYLALAKQWVWHSLGLLRPDLFIVDTFPLGSFGELLSALDLCRAKGFIYRPLKAAFAARADFQAMLPLYDAIVVPDHPSDAPTLVPEAARGRVRYVGPVIVRDRAEALERERARQLLGVRGGELVVYVSAGGGGDSQAERHLRVACDALAADPTVHLVVGAGPLYRGERRFGERITWMTQGGIAELLPAMDLAVCAAGYNTFFELMHFGVPALFVPQEKIADEQRARVQRAVRAGAGALLEELSPEAVVRAVDIWRDAGKRAAAGEAARSILPRNHARDAAAELLGLVLSAAEVDAAHDAIDDALLSAAGALKLPVETLLSLGHAFARGENGASGELLGEVAGLLRYASEEGIPLPSAQRVIEALARKLVRAGPVERARCVRRVLEALRPFDDWSGAALLLKAFSSEKERSAHAFTDELVSLLALLQREGQDLYQGMKRVARANQELLEAAGATR